MKILLIADAFPPLNNSAAIQLQDLSIELASIGHEILVVVPSSTIASSFQLSGIGRLEVLRVKAFNVKTRIRFFRALAEAFLPLTFLIGLLSSRRLMTNWEAVIWYSPTIFLGPLIFLLRKIHRCRTYLILRDIFPQWAEDMGLVKSRVAISLLKAVAGLQYKMADTIGIQAKSNKKFLEQHKLGTKRIELLENWLVESEIENYDLPSELEELPLSDKVILLYSGNIGVAQNLDLIVEAASLLRKDEELYFIIAGEGSELSHLKNKALSLQMDNIHFCGELMPNVVRALTRLSSIGIVSLDNKHQTHNIPGKFISYLRDNLPVLACVNKENELIEIINSKSVGRAGDWTDAREVADQIIELKKDVVSDVSIRAR
ncbi:MAG TPA: hypothetical protein DD622_01475, partial [Opitutae bacterium]|nr:hypothetical protein [Opitutae bacterium]